MKKQEQKHNLELSEFDRSVSLWQLLPSGSGKGAALLRTVTDSLLNSTNRISPSILITGPEGKRTHARAFSRSLGIDTIIEIDASLLEVAVGMPLFFDAVDNQAHIVANAEKLPAQGQHSIAQILKERRFSLYNYVLKRQVAYDVAGLVLLTATELSGVPEPVLSAIDYVVELEPYTFEQLQLVVLQRLKYCGVEYECEEVLTEIVLGGDGRLKQMIRFLRVCVAVMRAEGRQVLCSGDVERARRISGSKE